jgi:hypothetical protein
VALGTCALIAGFVVGFVTGGAVDLELVDLGVVDFGLVGLGVVGLGVDEED